MPNKAIFRTKPTLGPYIFDLMEKRKRDYYKETRKYLSDAELARQAGMTPEALRLIKAGETMGLMLENAIRLIQIFRDKTIAKHLEYLDPRWTEDDLIVSALYPLLNGKQKEATKRSIEFFTENTEADNPLDSPLTAA